MALMRAAVLHGPSDVRLERIAVPEPGPDEAVVRIHAVGMCGTDYRIWSGDRPVRYPLVMGHEFIGEVSAVGAAVSYVKAGDKVAVEPNYSCCHCPLCREGNRNLCLSRVAVGIDVDGGFAEAARVPARLCWPAPPTLADDQLVLAEPLNGADPLQRHHLIGLFRRLGAVGRAVIVSSHVLNEVEAMADRVIVIVRGRLAAAGGHRAIRDAMDDVPRHVLVRAPDGRRLAAALLGNEAVSGINVDGDDLVISTTRRTCDTRAPPRRSPRDSGCAAAEEQPSGWSTASS